MTHELVLIIEDNENDRKLARDVLAFKGYQTLESDSAEGGIRLAQEFHPALILMDIQLPAMNGIEALACLRADPKTKDIPVIAVTASAIPQNRQKMMTSGFDGHQRKPLHINEFLEAVRLAVGRAHDAG